MTEQQDRGVFGLIIILLFAVIAVVTLATAYGYSRSSGLFPRFVGWIFIGLVLIELSLQLKLFIAARHSATARTATVKSTGNGVNVLTEIKGFLWLAVLLTGLYLLGFLISIPLFTFAFLRVSAGKSLRFCTIVSAAATAFVYIVFVQLLEYKLHSGILFGA